MSGEAVATPRTRRSALVVAHPDDEVLFFSSVLRDMDQIVMCFGDVRSDPRCSAGRRRVIDQYPLQNVKSLGLQEAEAFETADWAAPVETPFGIVVEPHDDAMPGFSMHRYESNFEALRQRLRPLLEEASVVYTHSPWGEYGHEEHVQVFRAVEKLQGELGFEILFGLYASNKSAALLRRYLPRLSGRLSSAAPDVSLAVRLRSLYESHDCWTWYPHYEWPAAETFIRWEGSSDARSSFGRALPFNMIHVGWREPKRRRSSPIARFWSRG